MSAPIHPAFGVALAPLAWIYGAVLNARNRRYSRPGAARRADLPVISVGNLALGGTGKTPFTAWLALRLVDAGNRPAIVSRGYRGRAGRGPLIVSRGAGPLCESAVCGDEPFLLAERLDEVIVVVGSDRHAGAAASLREGADVILLDDGFQHRKLHRDLDIVLLDGRDPFGNGRVVPAGILREPPTGLNRAHVLLISGEKRDARFDRAQRAARQYNAVAPCFLHRRRRVGFVDRAGDARSAPARAVAFCGIANPERFRHDLEREGVELVQFHAYRDHHRFAPAQLTRFASDAAAAGATLVTTEKDLARIGRGIGGRSGPDLASLRIEADPDDAANLLDIVRRATGTKAR